MRKIIACIDCADGGDGLIQFTEFVLAGSSKKNLLCQENIIKEFNYLDVDHDGMIGLEDMRKFLISYSDNVPENVEMQTMLREIILGIPKKIINLSPEGWDLGPKFITFEVF